MDGWKAGALVGAVLVAGLLRGGDEWFKDFKAKRERLPAAIRNAGFITDRKVMAFQIVTYGAVYLWLGVTLIGSLFVLGAILEWWPVPF